MERNKFFVCEHYDPDNYVPFYDDRGREFRFCDESCMMVISAEENRRFSRERPNEKSDESLAYLDRKRRI